MFNDNPLRLSQIRKILKHDCYQLCTVEGDDFTQLKNLGKIAKEILKEHPDVRLFISSNDHDFGTYYGLEISDEDFELYDIEDEIYTISEKLKIDI